jgi:hypothetical protein
VRLFVYLGKITVEFTGGQQFRITHLPMFFQIPQMPLPPYTDGIAVKSIIR